MRRMLLTLCCLLAAHMTTPAMAAPKAEKQAEQSANDSLIWRRVERRREEYLDFQKEQVRILQESVSCAQNASTVAEINQCEVKAKEKVKRLRQALKSPKETK